MNSTIHVGLTNYYESMITKVSTKIWLLCFGTLLISALFKGTESSNGFDFCWHGRIEISKNNRRGWFLKKIENQVRRLFRPLSLYLCHQKPNPARETVTIYLIFYLLFSFQLILPISIAKEESLHTTIRRRRSSADFDSLRDNSFLAAVLPALHSPTRHGGAEPARLGAARRGGRRGERGGTAGRSGQPARLGG